jgi:hypothetical protein
MASHGRPVPPSLDESGACETTGHDHAHPRPDSRCGSAPTSVTAGRPHSPLRSPCLGRQSLPRPLHPSRPAPRGPGPGRGSPRVPHIRRPAALVTAPGDMSAGAPPADFAASAAAVAVAPADNGPKSKKSAAPPPFRVPVTPTIPRLPPYASRAPPVSFRAVTRAGTCDTNLCPWHGSPPLRANDGRLDAFDRGANHACNRSDDPGGRDFPRDLTGARRRGERRKV